MILVIEKNTFQNLISVDQGVLNEMLQNLHSFYAEKNSLMFVWDLNLFNKNKISPSFFNILNGINFRKFQLSIVESNHKFFSNIRGNFIHNPWKKFIDNYLIEEPFGKKNFFKFLI